MERAVRPMLFLTPDGRCPSVLVLPQPPPLGVLSSSFVVGELLCPPSAGWFFPHRSSSNSPPMSIFSESFSTPFYVVYDLGGNGCPDAPPFGPPLRFSPITVVPSFQQRSENFRRSITQSPLSLISRPAPRLP